MYSSGGYGAILFVIITALTLFNLLVASSYSYAQFEQKLQNYIVDRQLVLSAMSCRNVALLRISENPYWNNIPMYHMMAGRSVCTINYVSEFVSPDSVERVKKYESIKIIETSASIDEQNKTVNLRSKIGIYADGIDVISTHQF